MLLLTTFPFPSATADGPASVPGAPDSDPLLAARRREAENAFLTQALCGRPVGAAVLTQLRRYEAGELPREQAFADLYQG